MIDVRIVDENEDVLWDGHAAAVPRIGDGLDLMDNNGGTNRYVVLWVEWANFGGALADAIIKCRFKDYVPDEEAPDADAE